MTMREPKKGEILKRTAGSFERWDSQGSADSFIEDEHCP